MPREKGGNPERNVQKFAGFEVGKKVYWKTDKSHDTFTAPAFGYGEGSYELLNIYVSPYVKPDAEQFHNSVMLTIKTVNGNKIISADYLKPELTQKQI